MKPADILHARDKLGLTQAQFAQVLGYGHVMRVSQLERGERHPSPAAVRLIAAYLDGYRPAGWPKKKMKHG